MDAARLSQDGHALILQDEAGGRHGVAATTDPSTAAREIRLTGKPVLPTLVFRCGATARVIPLTATEPTAPGPVARYRVAEKMNVQQAPANSEDEFKRRIVQQYRVNERGAYVVVQPRAAVQNTVA